MTHLCIVAAHRTPQGRFMGALAEYSAVDLALVAGRAVLQLVKPDDIDQVIIGNVLAAGQGMNIARQIAVKLQIPIDRPAFTVNMMCASGMQAAILAGQTIRAGQARTILCGGTESMSRAPYLLDRARTGYRLGDGALLDSVLNDGLVDTFSHQHMGLIAERIAEQYHISRADQDQFALRSQQNYGRAHQACRFKDELVALKELDHDEHPRPDTSLQKLASLSTPFKPNGTVTAGNASGINDGAALLVVTDEPTALDKGWPPLAVIDDWATVGCDPQLMGLGPIYATGKLLQNSQAAIDDFDTVEINEAFAAQTLACQRELHIHPDRLNPDGGAIALGHPLGASGARLLVHLAHRIAQHRSNFALATLCVGGGMGAALALQAP